MEEVDEVDQRQYALRWNDYPIKLTSAFQNLRNDFIDVTIAGEDYTLSAHKVILSACSPYFCKLLKANPCKHPIIILQDVNKQNMEDLLLFMYNGEVHLEHDQLNSFIRAAQFLKIRGLTEIQQNALENTNIPDKRENLNENLEVEVPERLRDDYSPFPGKSTSKNDKESITTREASTPPPRLVKKLKGSPDNAIINHPTNFKEEPYEDDSIMIDDSISMDGINSAGDLSNPSSISNDPYYVNNSGTGGEQQKHDPSAGSEQNLGRNFNLDGTSRTAMRLSTEWYTTDFQCRVCKRFYSNQGNLNKHMKNLHAKVRKMYECSICHKKFTTSYSQKEHMNNVHSYDAVNKWYECILCKQPCETYQILITHEISTHQFIRKKKE